MLIKFIVVHLAFNDGVLYAANKTTIFLLDCKHQLKSGEVQKMEL